MPLSRNDIQIQLMQVLKELQQDWEYPEIIDESTGIFKDLEFESIDAVALGSAIEDTFKQSLPYVKFLTEAGQRNAEDISIGDLLDFLVIHLNKSQECKP